MQAWSRSGSRSRKRRRTTERRFDRTARPALRLASLHEAALDGRTEECSALVKQGVALNATTYWGFTPLEVAIITNHEDTALDLLHLGADPDAGTRPALLHAVSLGRLRAAEALLELGVDASAVDSWGRSALHLAVMVDTLTGYDAQFFPPVDVALG